MKLSTFFLSLIFSIIPITAIAQVNGAPGRVTGGIQSHGTFNFSSGGISVSCSSGCPASPYSSSTSAPSSQVVAGTLHFSTSHDDTGSIGGSSGGGTGLWQVSCDGGSTWISIDSGSATLPTTSMTFSFASPTCTGPTNLNTLLFKMVVAGGGPGAFNMNASSPTTTTITW